MKILQDEVEAGIAEKKRKRFSMKQGALYILYPQS